MRRHLLRVHVTQVDSLVGFLHVFDGQVHVDDISDFTDDVFVECISFNPVTNWRFPTGTEENI